MGLWAEGRAEIPKERLGSPSLNLSRAIVEKVSPLTVLPGTLVCIEGRGFGSAPGIIRLGDSQISKFLSWEDKCIFFSIPETGLATASTVQVGWSEGPDPLVPAPPGSLRIQWAVDTKALGAAVMRDWEILYGAPARPELSPPLYLKGQWVKKGRSFGTASESWDSGSKVRMLSSEGGRFWFSELVLTPENQASFGSQLLLFAFEDSNSQERDLFRFESNIMYILKKDWAKTDSYTGIDSDPAFRPSTKDPSYRGDRILLTYPSTQ